MELGFVGLGQPEVSRGDQLEAAFEDPAQLADLAGIMRRDHQPRAGFQLQRHRKVNLTFTVTRP